MDISSGLAITLANHVKIKKKTLHMNLTEAKEL